MAYPPVRCTLESFMQLTTCTRKLASNTCYLQLERLRKPLH